MRGSLDLNEGYSGVIRSIPACAGEPLALDAIRTLDEVDPRVCGGATVRYVRLPDGNGRSPRVRGSPLPGRVQVAIPRSIPACAGEPPVCEMSHSLATVDPRVCGGAYSFPDGLTPAMGRSPRVRGSPFEEGHVLFVSRSIPACAGEP